MSLPPDDVLEPVPAETARIAKQSFPQGTLALVLRDVLGTIYHDGMFADLYSDYGQPGITPWRLALITILQYTERLTDRQAAHAVQARIDWKYALALPLEHPGYQFTALEAFRERLLAGGAEERLLWAVLEACQARELVPRRGRQRTDSTHVVAAVRSLNRLELVAETMRSALEALAVAAPTWVRKHAEASWLERYERRADEARFPVGEEARRTLAETIGADGTRLLAALNAAETPAWFRELPAIQMLDVVWQQQYQERRGRLVFRPTSELPASAVVRASPYDPDARRGRKRQVRWVGYKAHLTELCHWGLPDLIISVQTTPATTPDQAMLETIWADLASRDLLPADHLVDRGYVDAPALVEAAQRGIDLIGPIQRDSSRQARAQDGYAQEDFLIDWTAKTVRCPQGATSAGWRESTSTRDTPVIEVHFADAVCRACPVKAQCTTAAHRSLCLLPQDQHEARQAARTRQETQDFRDRYRQRNGVEGTISQADRRTGLKHARYRGIEKVHLELVAKSTALNVIRLVDHFAGTPRTRARTTHLRRALAPAA